MFGGQDWTRPEVQRLDELRSQAVECWVEAAPALGRSAAAVPELEEHVARYPLREDGWRLLALALYRTGRRHPGGVADYPGHPDRAGRD
jgi:DNA-binding SARP family transcriptional activator